MSCRGDIEETQQQQEDLQEEEEEEEEDDGFRCAIYSILFARQVPRHVVFNLPCVDARWGEREARVAQLKDAVLNEKQGKRHTRQDEMHKLIKRQELEYVYMVEHLITLAID